MKALIGLIIAIVVIGGGWYYFTGSGNQGGAMMEKEGDSMMMEGSTEPQEGSYTVVASESSVQWEASKPLIPGYTHHGTFAVANGIITVGGETASGSFTLDMTALKVTSVGGGKAGQESALEAHLKNSDFFNVETYPTASFAITSITRADAEGTYTVTGNLTIKDTTESVTFPAMIYEKDGKLHATADFAIDRTRWGITFGSSSVFDGLADNAIGDEVTLTLSLVATADGAMMDKDGDAMMEDGEHMMESGN